MCIFGPIFSIFHHFFTKEFPHDGWNISFIIKCNHSSFENGLTFDLIISTYQSTFQNVKIGVQKVTILRTKWHFSTSHSFSYNICAGPSRWTSIKMLGKYSLNELHFMKWVLVRAKLSPIWRWMGGISFGWPCTRGILLNVFWNYKK